MSRLRDALALAALVRPQAHRPARTTDEATIRRRSAAAGEAAVLLRPISVLRPVEDDAATVRVFVLDQFPPMARRLARATEIEALRNRLHRRRLA